MTPTEFRAIRPASAGLHRREKMIYYELWHGIWSPRDNNWSMVLSSRFSSRADAEQTAKKWKDCPWHIVECKVVKMKPAAYPAAA